MLKKCDLNILQICPPHLPYVATLPWEFLQPAIIVRETPLRGQATCRETFLEVGYVRLNYDTGLTCTHTDTALYLGWSLYCND